MNDDLRMALERLTTPPESLTDQSDDDAWQVWLAAQIQSIANLGQSYPHGIRLHRRSSSATDRLNCFALALGIDSSTVGNGPCPGRDFTVRLVESSCLIEKEVELGEAVENDIIFYYSCGQLRHAGRLRGNKVISKWGYGRTHVWEHPPFEVPTTYGEQIKVFQPMSQRFAICTYNAWAEPYRP